jgi:hypothetical protein
MNTYEVLSKTDVREFTKKKGKFSYLSWAAAVDVLLKHCPDATWVVIENDQGWPYVSTPAGCFVTVSLTIDGVTRTQVHPVLDNRNKSIKEPDSFQVNTSIQRCLAKAISLHGLGLYIYRGEDLPDQDGLVVELITTEQINELNALIDLTQSDKDMFLDYLKISMLSDLKASQFEGARNALKKKLKV